MESQDTDAQPTGPRRPALLGVLLGLALVAALGVAVASIYPRVMAQARGSNPVLPAFSADGAALAALVEDRAAVYDTRTYRTLHQFAPAAGGTEAALVFSPDGSLLLVNRSMWDMTTGTLRYTLDSADAFRGAFSPDGSRVLTFVYDGLYLWDSASGARIARIPTASGCACQTALAFAADGTLVSAALDGIKTWRISDGEQLAAWKREGFANALALSPDGRLLAASEGSRVELWDVRTGQQILQLEDSPGAVNLLTFSPDGALLAGDSGIAEQAALVWDVQTGQQVWKFALPAKAAGLAFAPDDLRLAAGAYDGRVRVYDLNSGSLVRTIDDFTDWPSLIRSALTP